MRLCLLLSAFGTITHAQDIHSLSTDATGRVVYFATSLSQRGSGQAAVSKVFSLRDGELTLIAQSPAISGPNDTSFPSTALDANGDVRVVNRSLSCFGGSSCFFRELARTSIQTGSGTLAFGASAALTANGRFAALFGNTNQAPGVNLPPHSVQLLDLQSGQLTLAGSQAAQSGRIVSEDGTVLIAAIIGPDVQLVGPNRKIDLTPVGRMNQASLAGDASRIVYDQSNPRAMLEIEVLDVASGVTRPLGPGYAPVLAQDGRTFSYLKTSDFSSQVWMGDALTGSARALSNEVEGIFEQTIGGNGARVIAATATGRLLSIDTASGSVTQLLDPPPPGRAPYRSGSRVLQRTPRTVSGWLRGGSSRRRNSRHRSWPVSSRHCDPDSMGDPARPRRYDGALLA